jgi:hypothetical protein
MDRSLVDNDRSELTLEGTVGVSLLKGLAIKPILKRMVHRMDFTPLIQEAQRRAGEPQTQSSG